jgi:hypothetical protein
MVKHITHFRHLVLAREITVMQKDALRSHLEEAVTLVAFPFDDRGGDGGGLGHDELLVMILTPRPGRTKKKSGCLPGIMRPEVASSLI